MRKQLGEIFEEVRRQPTLPKKSEVLKANAAPYLFWFLLLAFKEDVKWMLPEGTPPYKQDPGTAGITPSHLVREIRKMYIFLEGGNTALRPARREQLYRQMLEAISATEVELLTSVKDKTFEKTFKCSRQCVEKTFPGLLEQPFNIRFFAE